MTPESRTLPCKLGAKGLGATWGGAHSSVLAVTAHVPRKWESQQGQWSGYGKGGAASGGRRTDRDQDTGVSVTALPSEAISDKFSSITSRYRCL